jgi:hypothetical protein
MGMQNKEQTPSCGGDLYLVFTAVMLKQLGKMKRDDLPTLRAL